MYINKIVKFFCFQDYHLNFHNYLMPSQFSVILYDFFLHIYDSCSFVIVDDVVFKSYILYRPITLDEPM